MKKSILVVGLILAIFRLLGEESSITGVVKDAKTGELLPFATLVIKGSTVGTVSNIEGRFVLSGTIFNEGDTLLVSYMGYETKQISFKELLSTTDIFLDPAVVNLLGVEVLARERTVRDVLKMVEENYEQNYPSANVRQRVFMHRYERTLFPEGAKLEVEEADFVGLDKKLIDDFMAKMPNEFVEYSDALVDIYHHDEEEKLMPVAAVSIEEGTAKVLEKEFESRFKKFFDDIKQTNHDDETYYKFKTGILSLKMNVNENDSLMDDQEEDTVNYLFPTEHILGGFNHVVERYAEVGHDSWEFLKHQGRYVYAMDITVFNDELVYEISFQPDRNSSHKKGLYQGVMYVDANTFAVLQLEFAYADGKSSENFNMFGIGHSLDYRQARIIYEKDERGYFVKYIYAQQHELMSFDRTFSFLKKKKRFLFDKSLNEIEMNLKMTFDISSKWEFLIQDRQAIDNDIFSEITQPKYVKFKKQYAYTQDDWEKLTILVPTQELKKYKMVEGLVE